MDLHTRSSHWPLYMSVLVTLIVLSVFVGYGLSSLFKSWRQYMAFLAVPLSLTLVFIVVAFSSSKGAVAVRTSLLPTERYVTQTEERAALSSLYHVTYVGHGTDGDTYRRADGSRLYNCSVQYTKHTTSVHLDALVCGQTVVR